MIRKVPDSDEPAEQPARAEDARPARHRARGRSPASSSHGSDAAARTSGGRPAEPGLHAPRDERAEASGRGEPADSPAEDGAGPDHVSGEKTGDAEAAGAGEASGGDETGGPGESTGAASSSAAGEATDGAGPQEPGSTCDRPLALRVEAVLFASGQALSVARLARVLDADGDEVRAALEELTSRWRERESAIDLVEISGGWRFMTRTAFHPDLAGLARKGKVEHLSPAALETLAVVAYRQPIGRADVEAVRGVQSGPLLRVLLDRDLIRIVGRSKEPGHPLLYGTTRRFLDHFGLKSLKELPDLEDLLDVS